MLVRFKNEDKSVVLLCLKIVTYFLFKNIKNYKNTSPFIRLIYSIHFSFLFTFPFYQTTHNSDLLKIPLKLPCKRETPQLKARPSILYKLSWGWKNIFPPKD